MCEPTTLAVASLAMAAAGTAATAYGANQQQRAMTSAASDADRRQAQLIRENSQRNYEAAMEESARNRRLMDAENQRQADYKKQMDDVRNQSIQQQGADNQRKMMADDAANRTNVYSAAADNISYMPSIMAGGEAAPSIRVIGDSAKSSAQSVADYLRGQAKSRANMEAFGNTAFNQGLAMQGFNNDLNQIGNFSQLSRGAFGAEQGASNNISGLLFGNINRGSALDQSVANNAASMNYLDAGYAGGGAKSLGSALSGLSGVGMNASADMRYGPKKTKP
jgi:hypothetical protein